MRDPFTKKQQDILAGMGNTVMSYIGSVHEVVSILNTRLAAMQVLLVTKGLMTMDEIEAAVQEIAAGAAVDAALSPEISALEEEMRRLLSGEAPPDATAEGEPRE